MWFLYLNLTVTDRCLQWSHSPPLYGACDHWTCFMNKNPFVHIPRLGSTDHSLCERHIYLYSDQQFTQYELLSHFVVSGLRITGNEQPLSIGARETFVCTTDLAVKSIQWLDNNNMNIISSSSQQPLSLIFDRVNDTIHSKRYTCRVTSPYGVQEDGFTVNVIGGLSQYVLYAHTVNCVLVNFSSISVLFTTSV